MSPKTRTFWPLLLILLLTDCATKELAVEQLSPIQIPHTVIDSFLRFTLVYNPGTAFGIDLRPWLGQWARPVLILLMIAVLAALARIYYQAAPKARLTAAALGLACGGAIGNLLDRFRYPMGVVDFIDVGVGTHRFWIFNVADAGITLGAIAISLILLRDDARRVATSEAV